MLAIKVILIYYGGFSLLLLLRCFAKFHLVIVKTMCSVFYDKSLVHVPHECSRHPVISINFPTVSKIY